MESILWSLQALGGEVTLGPIAVGILFLFLLQAWDFPIVLLGRLFQRTFLPAGSKIQLPSPPPAVLVVIPSLLRRADELASIKSTLQSIGANGYPGSVTTVVSIDGARECPALYSELTSWAKAQAWSGGFRLIVTGTPERRGKPMAIDHAFEHVKTLVTAGVLPAMPPVYVSTDADADLGPQALQHMVARLHQRHWLTGSPARAVAGALNVRGERDWQGWRHFFSVAGQLNLQVAREYYVGNIWRYNLRWLPVTGVPGALYCTWSEIFLVIPRFMGYSRTLRPRHWFSWWVGIAPPKFSESTARELPELIAGDTDDTVTAYVATLARYRGGRFVFDPPRTPLHALYYMVLGLFIDRPIRFEPRANVYTTSPTTARSLFRQRKRWNSSRVELAGRFLPVLGYHWTLCLPVLIIKLFMARALIFGSLAYVVFPLVLSETKVSVSFILGYTSLALAWALMTGCALLINADARSWLLLIGIPLAPAYQFVFNWLPFAVGVFSDLFLFGNRTGFAPEQTLIRGGSARLALLFRAKRAFSAAVRSAFVGDIPFGGFWFGWRETRWTPSGFEEWSRRKSGTLWRKPALRVQEPEPPPPTRKVAHEPR